MSCLLGLGSVLVSLLLAANVVVGWLASHSRVQATTHINVSFVATIGVLFCQAMLLFYLLGSVRRVRQVTRDRKLDAAPLQGLPAMRAVLPLACLAIVAVMAAFILGGGAHTGVIAPAVHGWIGLTAALLQLGSLLQELKALRALETTIQSIEATLDE